MMISEQDINNAKTPDTQSEADRELANRLDVRWGQLETDALNFKTHWQECYENIVPRKEDVVATRMPGDRRNSDLYDTTAILANEMLASALHGMLTNPESRFFELTFGDPVLDEDEEVKNWCQDCGDRMFRVLNNSNFQTEIYEIYVDLGAIGTACLFMGESDKDVVRFSARALKEIRIDENSEGLVVEVHRLFKWRPAQIIEEFGKANCSRDILIAASKNSTDQMEILHVVEPMNALEQRIPSNKLKSHTSRSVYMHKASKFILSKDGFREFPYAVPRWSKTSGEKYGRGPGMSMLPDILMINAMALTVIQGAQKTIDPPLQVQDDGVIGTVRLTPGGLTVVRAGSEPIKPLIIDARIDFGQQLLEDVRNRIRAGFYVDQLQLRDGPQMTAEEVRQRTEERLRLMGPVLGRQHFELLRPLIARLFDIMARKGMLPQAPPKIRGKSFDVRYSSLIARAQRVSEAQNLVRAFQTLEPLAKMKPEIMSLLDAEKVVRYVWDIYGNKHSLLLSKREYEKQLRQQQQAAQKAAEMQNQMHEAEVANKTAPMISAVQQGQQANASRS